MKNIWKVKLIDGRIILDRLVIIIYPLVGVRRRTPSQKSGVCVNYSLTLARFDLFHLEITEKSVLACCVKMPVWKHKKCFYVQHKTQIHTQPKIAKNAQKTQKYTSFRAYFRRFWTYFGRFYGWKSSFGAFPDTGIYKRTLPTYKWRKIFTIFSVSRG